MWREVGEFAFVFLFFGVAAFFNYREQAAKQRELAAYEAAKVERKKSDRQAVITGLQQARELLVWELEKNDSRDEHGLRTGMDLLQRVIDARVKWIRDQKDGDY